MSIAKLERDIEELKKTDPTEWGAGKKWRKLWELQAMSRWIRKGVHMVKCQEYSWGTWEREYHDPHMIGYSASETFLIRGDAYNGFMKYGKDYGISVVEWDGFI